MPRSRIDQENFGTYSLPANGERSPALLADIAVRTKLRTLADMSEREIKALEKYYGCPIQRPNKRRSVRAKV